MVRRVLFLCLLSLSFHDGICQTAEHPAAKPSAGVSLAPVKFLIGKWSGEGSAETGQAGSGFCSFELTLQDKVLLRKNHSEYPATKEHPAIVHDDLLIVYPDQARQQLRAFYTDNEGHVINYSVTTDGKGTSAVFLGDLEAGQPRFRLTYALTAPGHMTVTFEMAPSDKPEQFQKFIEGKLRQTSGTS